MLQSCEQTQGWDLNYSSKQKWERNKREQKTQKNLLWKLATDKSPGSHANKRKKLNKINIEAR
uniref:Uncharacterized protein n=1 Tax=Anguilla anguilla TaxID=7936 RepID=A0A0E9UMJ4_ANGAN